MTTGLYCLEVSHRTARRAIRERLAATDVPTALSRARGLFTEAALLSTCGRCELYVVADAPPSWGQVVPAVFGLSTRALRPSLRIHAEQDATRHLLRVGAGIESPIFGEDQILGQVRDAFAAAQTANTIGPILATLFRTAIHAGRRVRRETHLGHAVRSYAQRAVEQVLMETGPCRAARSVLVLGSGTLATELVARLVAADRRVLVASRHAERARQLAQRLGAQAIDYDDLPMALTQVDAVIAATAARQPILTRRHLSSVTQPLTLVDLGMPANIATDVTELSEITLARLENLVSGEAVPIQRVAAVDAILVDEQRRYARWLGARQVSRLIVELQSLTAAAAAHDPRLRRAVHVAIRRLQEDAAA